MNKFFKRICALLLACMTVIGLCVTNASAESSTTAIGDSLVSVTSDSSTSGTWSDVFTPGSADRNTDSEGKVWVDKSVSADASDASFDITLSAMSEEYELSAEERAKLTSQQAADVLIVLDFSGSMKYAFGNSTSYQSDITKTRAYAMTQAVNDVMYQIMTANVKNRVMITYFTDDTFVDRRGNINNDGVVLPLGSYGVLQSDGSYTIPKAYFKLTGGSSSNSARYFEDNVTITNMSTKETVEVKQLVSGGTMSQYGIAYGCNRLITQMQETTFDVQRTPFILFMTDGEANNAAKEWDDVVNDKEASDNNEIAALTILTAAYQKDLTIAAYNTRNNVKGNTLYEEITDIDWFNVGVSLSAVSGTPTWMQVMMDPTLTETSGSNVPAKVHNYIVSNAKNRSKTEYGSTDKYRYTETGYVTYAQAADEVVKAFANLGEKVARLTGGTVIPITKKTTAAEEDEIFITFTDTIGDGMELVKNSSGVYDIKIQGVYDSDTHAVTTTEYTGQLKADSTNVYEFVNGDTTLKSTATVNGSSVVWKINANELPIVRFASRNNPGTAYDYDGCGTAEVYEKEVNAPIKMTYTVKATENGVKGLSKDNLYLYSNSWSGSGNGTTTAVFTPSASNTYYKDKTSADVESKEKVTNTTATAANVYTGAWNSGKSEYTVNLGNNGRATLMAKIELTADKTEAYAGEEVNYTIKITNLSGEKIEGAEVTAAFNGATIESSVPEQSEGKWTVDIGTDQPTEITVKVKAGTTGGEYDETADMTHDGKTIKTQVDLKVTVGSTVTVNTKLNGDPASIGSIVSDGTKLYLKDIDGVLYETTSTETGKYVADKKLLDGEYEIVYGPDKDHITSTGEKVTVSGSDVSSDFNWYTVEFDNNGHGGTDPESQNVIKDKSATEPTAPTDSDYKFDGWYTDQACTEGKKYDFSSAVTEETTLFAKWTYIVKPSDVKLGKTADRTNVNVGDTFEYTLTAYVNRTDVTASAVIKDEIPEGLTVLWEAGEVPAGVTYDSGTRLVTWTLSELPKGESNKVSLVIPVEVTEESTAGKFVNTAKLTELGGKDVSTDPEAPKPEVTTSIPHFTVEKSVDKSIVNAGDTVTYSITITNEASTDATISFADKLPAGLEILEDTISDNGTYDDTTNPATITWSDIVVEGNDAKSVTFNAKVPETLSAEATYANVAFVTKVGDDPYIGPGSENNNPGTTPLTAKPATKIKVEKVWSDGWASHGNDTVDITVYANGTPLNEKVTLDYDNQSVEKSYPSVDASGNDITYSVEEKTVEGYTPAYSQKTESGVNVYTITNSYAVKPSDVKMSKTADRTNVNVGDKFNYTLTAYVNRTDVTASAVIKDEIPEGLTVLWEAGEVPAGVTYDSGTRLVTWTLSELPKGESNKVSLVIPVEVTEESTAGKFVNTAKLTELGGKDVSTDPEAPKPEVSTNIPGFTVEKSVTVGGKAATTVNAGDTVTYSIKVTNTASENATISFTDKLPAGLEIDEQSVTAAGGTYSGTENTITWTGLEVEAGQYETLTFNAKVPETLSAETTYTNVAFVTKVGNEDYTGPGSEEDSKREDYPGKTPLTAEPLTKINIVKNWSDGWAIHEDDTVYIKVYANGTPLNEEVTLDYQHQSVEKSYPAVDADGNGITYTIAEDRVKEGYSAAVDGYTVTNSYVLKPSDMQLGKTATDAEKKAITTVKAGDTFNYTLTVKNTRTDMTATEVEVEEILPDGLEVYSVSPAATDAFIRESATSQKYTWKIASIAPQATAELVITVKVPDNAGAVRYTNQAKLTKLCGETVPDTKDNPAPTSPATTTDVLGFSIAKDVKYNDVSVSGGSAYSGRTVSYSISVTNDNPSKSAEIELVDEMPADLMPTNVAPEAVPVYDDTAGVWKIIWKLTIAGGETKVFSYNAAVPQGLENNTVYTNLAYISSVDDDPSYDGLGSKGNNPGTVTFTGVPAKVITVSKTWSDKWNDSEAHENPHAATSINIYADGVLKDTVVFEDDTEKELWLDKYNDKGEEIVYTFKEVGAGGKEIENGTLNGLYKFEYDQTAVNNDGIAAMTNTYQIQPDDLDFNKTATDTNGNPISSIKAGDTFVYTLTVNNTRKYETATNIVVEDTLPKGLTVESVVYDKSDSLDRGLTESDSLWYRWTITTLSPNTPHTLKLVVSVPDDVTAAEYINKAEIKNIGETPIPEGTKPSPTVKTTLRSFTVTKTWLDGNGNTITDSSMPDVTAVLLQNGEAYREVILNSGNGWTYTWEELPMRDAEGKLFTYSVDEVKVDGYTTVISYYGKSDTYGNAAALIKNTHKSVTVSYEFAGDDIPSDVTLPAGKTVAYGTEFTAEAKPSKDYYDFYGWCTSDGKIFTDGTVLDDAIAPGGTMVLYGWWSRDEVTITPTFAGKVPSGVKLPEPVTLKRGEEYTVPQITNVPSGYKFAGWYLDPECTVAYTGGTLNADTTIYGKWQKLVTVQYQYTNPYPVGASQPASERVAANEAYYAATYPSSTGCTFLGWYTDPECTWKFTDGTVITADTVLYGKWSVPTASTTTTTTTTTTTGTTTTTTTTTTTSTGVKTGDDSHLEWYMVTCAVSASVCAAAAVCIRRSGKKKKEQ